MRILRLNLKRRWWEEIRDGRKTDELRLDTAYWRKRLDAMEYDEVHLCLGYPRADDESRILRRKWRGAELRTVTHEEFGPEPVQVFAIDVREKIKD